MSQKYEKLKTLLKELFQLDQPDLDFGLYRVMHTKSAEVTQFLDKDLLPQVKAAFGQYKTADKAEIEKELAKVIAGIEAAAMDPAQSPKVNELRARFKSDAVDVAALESEVYDHLYSFFRRYYSEGDFLAKRVYKPGVYAIPYEGEEVTLHWANKDQYYIKTSEYLRDYAFRLRPAPSTSSGQAYKPMRVHFRLADAAEGEHGNVKAAEGKERVFILAASGTRPNVIEQDGEQGKELVIRFEYRPATLTDWPEDARDSKSKPPTQKDLIAFAARRVLAVVAGQVANLPLQEWVAELGKLDPTEKESERTVFTKHLKKYSDINKFDYFIHKNLGGFLGRELDFYIKNEVMHLDDVESETAPRVEQYLSKIKVIRRIASKIIDFLAQIEDFQKKLWLKKKFVVETQYCITLGCIPEAFYPEIAANEAQRAEWVELSAVDEIQGDLVTQGYSKPLKPDFLKAHPTLVVDTRHFDAGFTVRLLEALGDLDEQTDGVLFHSENFQALSLMQARYREQVKCVYIDPPYNTGGDGFPYRDDYQHSSWIAMVEDRLILNRQLLTPDGVIFASIDANERVHLEFTMAAIFGRRNRVEEIIWVTNAMKNQSPTYSTNHEYVEVFARDIDTAKQEVRMFREPKLGYGPLQELLRELNPSYPPTAEIEAALRHLFRTNQKKLKDSLKEAPELEDEEADDWKGLYNYTHAEYRDSRGAFVPEHEAKQRKAVIWVWREDNPSMPQVKADSQKPEFRDPEDPTFRFYRPIHPVTGKSCTPPKRGWAWPFNRHGRQTYSFVELAADQRICWGTDENKIPQIKRFLHEVETNVAKSVVTDFTDGEKQLTNLFGRTRAFSNPKPTTLVARFARQTTWNAEFVLDFFGGSGTTGHATINLNREDGGRRKFILVEMGDHFDTVLLPRIKKVIFTPEWKDGKPKRLATPEEAERSPRIVKVVRLESYEDALNNLETRRTDKQQLLFDAPEAQGADGLKEQYLLRYMLNVETRGSQSLLNVQAFTDPTAYKLKVKRPGSDESRVVNVDLLETFNWLIGLTVRQIAAPQIFSAACERDSEKRLRLKGRLKQEADGPYWFRTVTGTTPDGRTTLIIWRKLTGEPEQDNLVLDEWFRKHAYSTKDADFDLIYVNGGNNLPNVRRDDETWKVRLIEEDFHRLMFEMEGV